MGALCLASCGLDIICQVQGEKGVTGNTRIAVLGGNGGHGLAYCSKERVILRGTIVIRTYGIHKNLYV